MKKKPMGGASTFAQRRKLPPPDLKDAVRHALEAAAQQLEAYSIIDLWGAAAYNGDHAAIYEEAQKVAVNYIRMGSNG